MSEAPAPAPARRPWPIRRARPLIALALAIGSFAWVASAQRAQGIARDETVYMSYGGRYAAWWSDLVTGVDDTLTEKAITAHFGGDRDTDGNREHPPLMKTLFGFSKKLFDDGLGWTGAVTAYRLPTAAMNGLLIALVFLFTSSVWGLAEGLIAALATLLLPRAFFHAGLACFDAPITTLWFAALYAYYKALGSRRWCLGFGVVFGLALATKHNAILLPVAIVAHYLWVALRSQRAAIARPPEGDRPVPPTVARRVLAWSRALGRGLWQTRPLALVAMVLLGPLVLIALWPWLWFDTASHIGAWLSFHLHHTHYNFEYLGDNWNAPPFPWHVAIVTTLLTVPVTTLLAAAFGAWTLAASAWRGAAAHAARAPALLLFLSAGVSMGPFLLGSTPIFGAEKHWAPAIPTLCIFAGVGVVAAARLAARALQRGRVLAATRAGLAEIVAIAGIATLVLVAAAVETVHAQPYALTDYNALAGGAPGGADLGMNRQFWGYAARGVLPYLNEHAPAKGEPPAPVYSHDASPAWGLYRSEGLLAKGLPDSGNEDRRGIEKSAWALVIHERHFNRHDYLVWNAYGTVQPVYVLRKDGVPIVSVYHRPLPLPASP